MSNKITLGCLLFLAAVGYYLFSSMQEKNSQMRTDSAMALSHLADKEGWISMVDQLTAVNNDSYELTTEVIKEEDYLVTSVGTIRADELCKIVTYTWVNGERKSYSVVDVKDC
ncbi:hypothetical protein [Vibrio paucivorans]